MGRPKGMTREKVAERNEKIYKDVERMSFPAICKKYGIGEAYIKQLVRGRDKMERETLNEAVAPAVSPKAVEKLMADATKLAALPAAPKDLPELKPVVSQKAEIVPSIVGTPIKKLGKIFITIDVQYEESK